VSRCESGLTASAALFVAPAHGAHMDDVSDTGAADDGLVWETLDTDLAYACPGFDVRTDRVRLPDGTETAFDSIDEPSAVVVLPFTADGDVLLIEEWRQAVGRINRGLPAGTLESDDEAIERAARRELEEETGYVAGTIEHLVTVEPLNGLANSVHHHVVARECTPTGERDLDFNESIRVDTTTLDVLLEAVGDGAIRDGRTVTNLLYFERYGSA